METKVLSATEEEIAAIKGVHRYDVAAQDQAEAVAAKNSTYGIMDPSQTQPQATSGAVPEPAAAQAVTPAEPTQPVVEPAKVEVKPSEKSVELAKDPALDYKFTKEYIAEAKAALSELKVSLGEAKFSELEESIKKGLDSPFFIKNAKGGYTAKENIADIALKAQGFVNVPSAEDKAAKVAAVRDVAKVAPSPVIDTQQAKGKTQKDYLKDLKSGDPAARKAAMYKLTGVDETMGLIDGYMKRK